MRDLRNGNIHSAVRALRHERGAAPASPKYFGQDEAGVFAVPPGSLLLRDRAAQRWTLYWTGTIITAFRAKDPVGFFGKDCVKQ